MSQADRCSIDNGISKWVVAAAVAAVVVLECLVSYAVLGEFVPARFSTVASKTSSCKDDDSNGDSTSLRNVYVGTRYDDDSSRTQHLRRRGNETYYNDTYYNYTAEDRDILAAVAAADANWKVGRQGYLWMQHSRKAGGTTLCMTLRLNSKGLVRVTANQFNITEKRTTCQLLTLCGDCDVKSKFRAQVEQNYGGRFDSFFREQLNNAGRNFIELEGNGVPVDMVVAADAGARSAQRQSRKDPWEDFVFVSTIREPLARIVSDLESTHTFRCGDVHGSGDVQKTAASKACVENLLRDEAVILGRCRKGVYECHSNYYVRIFSGLDAEYTTDADMLARAKRNFKRFSCVVLQERWSETARCLGTRLGLYLTTDLEFNVVGHGLKKAVAGVRHEDAVSFLSENTQSLLRELNRVDFEFYEWAKEWILGTMI